MMAAMSKKAFESIAARLREAVAHAQEDDRAEARFFSA